MSLANLSSISHQIVNKQFKNIYFVYGEEDYFHHQIVTLFEKYTLEAHEKDLNTDILYGDQHNGTDVLSACLALPMMAERRLVIVHQFDQLNFADENRFIQYLENPEIQTIAVFLAKKINRNKKLHKALLKHAISIEANPIKSDSEIHHWLNEQFKRRKKSIHQDAIRLIQNHCGNNLYELSSQIEKIITYSIDKTEITVSDIEDIVGISKDLNPYELQNAIIFRKKENALSILKHLLEQGEDPIYLNSLIYYRFVKQWMLIQAVKENMNQDLMSKQLQVPKYYLKDYTSSVNMYNLIQCNQIIQKLTDTDIKLKSTSVDAYQLLTFTLIHILNIKGNP